MIKTLQPEFHRTADWYISNELDTLRNKVREQIS